MKFSRYDAKEAALLNLRRFKTGTTTKFFPLSRRAAEIVEERYELQKGSDFIFSPDGKTIESTYRTLKKVCEKLNIPYGRYTDGGFIAYDLRHNFGTEILQTSDIETARELLGQVDILQTGTYVHTTRERMREAVRKRDKVNHDSELSEILKADKNDELNERGFIETMKKILI